ncbi:response regulator [Bacillus infantis]|jgi:DNA-binding NarL/FixJ family response regulator|uniref:response regulator n=1 Tax=Bacillus infantis TaxID=324767 RepID=UPI003CFA317C
MNRILIVEDQVIVRQGLRMIIEQDGAFSVAGEAENGKEAIEKMESHGADIILMDIQMPVMNGIEATRMIRKRWPAVKILILTTFNDEEYALQTLREGTNGFLLKTSDGPRLLQSIRSCLEGGISIHEQVAAKVMPKLLDHSCHKEAEVPLTPRERDIARLIGRGKSNKEIAKELYLSVGTVKNHLTQILQKLDLRDRTQLAIFAVKNDIL